ncbi:hypothetical protein WMY93_029811 [Mugilogobius chulae]|uniref:Uncharacterized protein n=1 Tax=Mugilogobius chulae TaxID=88201 RepID=A0AAW0MKW7_9GOBI
MCQRAVWHSPVRKGCGRGLCGTARSESDVSEGCVAQPGQNVMCLKAVWHSPHILRHTDISQATKDHLIFTERKRAALKMLADLRASNPQPEMVSRLDLQHENPDPCQNPSCVLRDEAHDYLLKRVRELEHENWVLRGGKGAPPGEEEPGEQPSTSRQSSSVIPPAEVSSSSDDDDADDDDDDGKGGGDDDDDADDDDDDDDNEDNQGPPPQPKKPQPEKPQPEAPAKEAPAGEAPANEPQPEEPQPSAQPSVQTSEPQPEEPQPSAQPSVQTSEPQPEEPQPSAQPSVQTSEPQPEEPQPSAQPSVQTSEPQPEEPQPSAQPSVQTSEPQPEEPQPSVQPSAQPSESQPSAQPSAQTSEPEMTSGISLSDLCESEEAQAADVKKRKRADEATRNRRRASRHQNQTGKESSETSRRWGSTQGGQGRCIGGHLASDPPGNKQPVNREDQGEHKQVHLSKGNCAGELCNPINTGQNFHQLYDDGESKTPLGLEVYVQHTSPSQFPGCPQCCGVQIQHHHWLPPPDDDFCGVFKLPQPTGKPSNSRREAKSLLGAQKLNRDLGRTLAAYQLSVKGKKLANLIPRETLASCIKQAGEKMPQLLDDLEEAPPRDRATRFRFLGHLAAYISCIYGHRPCVLTKMTCREVRQAYGNDTTGYLVNVLQHKTVQTYGHAQVYLTKEEYAWCLRWLALLNRTNFQSNRDISQRTSLSNFMCHSDKIQENCETRKDSKSPKALPTTSAAAAAADSDMPVEKAKRNLWPSQKRKRQETDTEESEEFKAADESDSEPSDPPSEPLSRTAEETEGSEPSEKTESARKRWKKPLSAEVALKIKNKLSPLKNRTLGKRLAVDPNQRTPELRKRLIKTRLEVRLERLKPQV